MVIQPCELAKAFINFRVEVVPILRLFNLLHCFLVFFPVNHFSPSGLSAFVVCLVDDCIVPLISMDVNTLFERFLKSPIFCQTDLICYNIGKAKSRISSILCYRICPTTSNRADPDMMEEITYISIQGFIETWQKKRSKKTARTIESRSICPYIQRTRRADS
nr:MAG TPA: hypothetical protein [Ackermannviridae sp.]